LNWPAIHDVFLALVLEHAGVPCYWAHEPQPFAADPATARLEWLGSGMIGWDDNRNSVDQDGNVVQTRVGNRWFVIRCTIESETQDPSALARTYLERLRTRLYFDSVTARLDALDVALTRDENLVSSDTEESGRMISRASIDFRCTTIDVETDSTAPQGAIEGTEIFAPVVQTNPPQHIPTTARPAP
jgi:hypothetical protein